jgi:MazG family protein
MNTQKEKLCDALISLLEIMERLRAPDGCPWDAQQTEQTLKVYLLEEAYEVLDAIEKEDSEALCEELGDLFFQIIFLTQLAKEKGKFTFLNVMERIRDKMIRRHPHVFGEKKVRDAQEVVDNWAKIKRQEKKEKPEEVLNRVPASLPALLRAHRLSERAARFGFDWKDKEQVWEKVKEEFLELKTAMEEKSAEKVKEEIGDLIFSLVNLSRHWGFNAEDILRHTNTKFTDRFNKMILSLREKGIDVEKASIEQMDQIWEEIKRDA